jgi:predicted XRE-type DNA-binding protein
MTKARDIKIEGSTGNVFADLGFENPDEELLKAQLAHRIGALLAERRATQGNAAALLGTTQPKVSLLVRGRTEAFSVQKLFGFLNRLDQDVVVAVRPKPSGQPSGRTTLVPMADPTASAADSFRYGRTAAKPSKVRESTPSRRTRAAKAGTRSVAKSTGRGTTPKKTAKVIKKSSSTRASSSSHGRASVGIADEIITIRRGSSDRSVAHAPRLLGASSR